MQSGSTTPDVAGVLERLVRLVRLLATAGDLSTTAAAVLARVERDGAQRVTELAQAEGVAQPGMTQLVTRLERDGLVRRVPDPADGRAVLIEITARGRRIVGERRRQRAAALHDLVSRLSPADRNAIDRALPALNRLTEL